MNGDRSLPESGYLRGDITSTYIMSRNIKLSYLIIYLEQYSY